ncbi:MAG: polyhydroxyalkanoate synthesis repressor PhaR [Gammaproteobacteria bacterium]|nr:polyhydroxyalkanoate synthesis repressor PhaR [Gammaproteobacteria bacterium]
MTRVIKKYPNRRLYDTDKSCYITLSNVKELVMAGIDFKVIDTNSSEDLTRSILLQIIMEEETHGKPIFSANTLAQLIKFYGGTAQGVFGQYLEESLSAFANQQDLFTSNSQAPMQNISDIAQKNIKMWTDMQQSFFNVNPDDSKDNKS